MPLHTEKISQLVQDYHNNPPRHIITTQVEERCDQKGFSNAQIFETLAHQAEKFRNFIGLETIIPVTTTEDGEQLTIGSTLLVYPASPHTDILLKDLGITTDNPKLPAHFMVWWDDLSHEEPTDIFEIGGSLPRTRDAYTQTIAAQITTAREYLKTAAINKGLVENHDFVVKVYGLSGYVDRATQRETGLERSSQSSPHGHINVVLELQDSGRALLNLKPSTLYNHKSKPFDVHMAELTKITDLYSYLPFLAEADRSLFDAWITEYIKVQLEIELPHFSNNTADYKLVLSNSPYSLSLQSDKFLTTEAQRMSYAAVLEHIFQKLYSKLRGEYDKHWKTKLDLLDADSEWDCTNPLFPMPTVDTVLQRLFAAILPTRTQIETWSQSAEMSQKACALLQRYQNVYERALSEYKIAIGLAEDETTIIQLALLLDLVRPITADAALPILPKNIFANRFSSIYRSDNSASTVEICMVQGQKGAIQYDNAIVDR